jgi:kumamolisin
MVPDVAANADPATGYMVRVNGQAIELGGTSAAAPLWAALIVRLNAALGRKLGFVNPALYALAPGSLRDITSGSNGAFSAAAGYDMCTGLGTVPANLQGLLT